MLVSNASPAIAWRMTDREWDKLVNLVLEGCVVPVIGAEQVGLAIPKGDDPTLYDVTNYLSQSQNPNELAYAIDDVVRRRSWPAQLTGAKIGGGENE
jgi:hypothetical protein